MCVCVCLQMARGTGSQWQCQKASHLGRGGIRDGGGKRETGVWGGFELKKVFRGGCNILYFPSLPPDFFCSPALTTPPAVIHLLLPEKCSLRREEPQNFLVSSFLPCCFPSQILLTVTRRALPLPSFRVRTAHTHKKCNISYYFFCLFFIGL